MTSQQLPGKVLYIPALHPEAGGAKYGGTCKRINVTFFFMSELSFTKGFQESSFVN